MCITKKVKINSECVRETKKKKKLIQSLESHSVFIYKVLYIGRIIVSIRKTNHNCLAI